MLNQEYELKFAELGDLDSWMKMIEIVKENFPGLKTKEQIDGYKQTVIKNISRKTALCVKQNDEIVGVLLFSYSVQCLSCMAVHPKYRRKGIASFMIEKMLDLFGEDVDITVSTFREDDELGKAPRTLYQKYGFVSVELTTEFEYPHEKFILRRG